jgi:hypothetical protein
MLSKLVGPDAGGAVIDYFKQKQQLKQQLTLAKLQGKIDIQKAKDSLAVQQLQSDTQLEHDQLTSPGNSLRQDWVLLLLSTPLVMAFIPPLQPYVESGFKALAQCPGWYKYTTVTVLLAIYGIRKVSPFFKKKGDKDGTQSDDKENG